MERPSGSEPAFQPTQKTLRKAYKASEAMNGWGETIAWWSGHIYTGHTVTKVGDGWRLIVRAETKGGKAVIKMVHAPTVTDCVWLFNRSMVSKGIVEWTPDKYAR